MNINQFDNTIKLKLRPIFIYENDIKYTNYRPRSISLPNYINNNINKTLMLY